MTRESKANLRARLAAAHQRINTAEYELIAARIKLNSLGYERTEGPHEVFGTSISPQVKWVKTEAQLESEKLDEALRATRAEEERAAREEARQIDLAAAEDLGRRTALQAVIDALELTDYRPSSFSQRLGITQPTLTDQLWADLNTTLEAREAEKHAATVAATRKRVEGLAKGPQFLSVQLLGEGITRACRPDGRVTYGFDPAGDDRPDKAPQGLVSDVAVAPKKTTANKKPVKKERSA